MVRGRALPKAPCPTTRSSSKSGRADLAGGHFAPALAAALAARALWRRLQAAHIISG